MESFENWVPESTLPVILGQSCLLFADHACPLPSALPFLSFSYSVIFFWLWERSAPFDFELSQVEPLTDERLATADGNSVTVGGAITANNRHLETRVLRIVYGETSPFSPLIDIPRYISRDTYLTVYADKSEYFLRLSSLFCFSVEWLPLHWLHTNELRLFNWYTVPLVHP